MTRSARRDDPGARRAGRIADAWGRCRGPARRGARGSPGGRDDGREARGGPGGAARGGAAAAKKKRGTREPATSAPGTSRRVRRAICPRGDATRDASWSTRGARPKPAALSHRQPRRSRFIQEHCWTPDARFITRCAARSASVENSRTVAASLPPLASPPSRFSHLSYSLALADFFPPQNALRTLLNLLRSTFTGPLPDALGFFPRSFPHPPPPSNPSTPRSAAANSASRSRVQFA